MKKVIMHADDFGLSKDINRGIIKGFNAGIITSASLMVNMPGFDDAVRFAKENPSLGIGVHLNIIRGKPVLKNKQFHTIVNAQGYFNGFYGFLRKLLFFQIDLEEVRSEFKGQIEKAVSLGIKPTHLDTEKHIHLFPPIFEILANLSAEYKIYKMRVFKQNLLSPAIYYPVFFDISYVKFLPLFYLSLINLRILKKYKIKTPDFLYCLSEKKEEVLRILHSLDDGITELICHPGFFSEELEGNNGLGKFEMGNSYRQKQLSLLLSAELKHAMRDIDISLINYGEL